MLGSTTRDVGDDLASLRGVALVVIQVRSIHCLWDVKNLSQRQRVPFVSKILDSSRSWPGLISNALVKRMDLWKLADVYEPLLPFSKLTVQNRFDPSYCGSFSNGGEKRKRQCAESSVNVKGPQVVKINAERSTTAVLIAQVFAAGHCHCSHFKRCEAFEYLRRIGLDPPLPQHLAFA